MSISESDGPYAWSSGNRNPHEIEREIEGTRRELARTISALQSRLSPQERLRAMGKSAQDYAERLTRSAADAVLPGITGMIRLDHTHVLALFRRFRPWTSASRKRALVTNACLAIEIHAQLEEEIFYPVMRVWRARTPFSTRAFPSTTKCAG